MASNFHPFVPMKKFQENFKLEVTIRNVHIGGQYIPNTPLAIHMYAAAKHAVLTLTEELHRELVREKSKIRVTSPSPRLVETEFLEASGREMDPKQFYSSLPCLQPKDIADCVLFALAVPPHVQIHELMVKPTGETF